MLFKKKTSIVSRPYESAVIEIPISRLKKMIQVGDVITGWRGCSISASCVGYRVTAVHHWGVFAYPTVYMLEGLKGSFKTERLKKHYKFKWCNITGIRFKEEE